MVQRWTHHNFSFDTLAVFSFYKATILPNISDKLNNRF